MYQLNYISNQKPPMIVMIGMILLIEIMNTDKKILIKNTRIMDHDKEVPRSLRI